MELLCIASKISVELLWVSRLDIILFFFINDIFKLNIASSAIPLPCIMLNALIMIRMATHKMNRRQAQRLLATITLFWVEVFSLGFEVLNLGTHCFYFLHVLIHLLIVLFDDTVLHLQSIQKVLFDDFELQIGF